MTIILKTFNGDYEIEPFGDNFSVQIQGDEQVFNTEKEARKAIYEDEVNSLWDNPPYNGEKMVNNYQLQEMLNYIREDTDRKRMFCYILRSRDELSIKNVIEDGDVEYFDRYDSDVAEQFINLYMKFPEIYLQYVGEELI